MSSIRVQVPGRVNLIGEHTDYNGGWVVPAAIDLSTSVSLRLRGDAEVHGSSRELGTGVASLHAPAMGHWLDYARGVALEFFQEYGLPPTGFELEVQSELPLGAGLSSSAALTVGVGLALMACFDIELRTDRERLRLAEACRRAENKFIGVPCGLMDPLILVAGTAGHALRLDCELGEFERVPIPSDLELLIIDTGVRRELRDGSFAARQEQCQGACASLGRLLNTSPRSLRHISREEFESVKGQLGSVERLRAEHVIGENQRVHEFCRALAEDDRGALGELMHASHRSLSELFEVTWPEADRLVDAAASIPGVHGSRMTGAGWGGCTLHLVETEAIPAAAEALAGRSLSWWSSKPVAGGG